ncbi:MAG: glutathione S-transferase family protein, partial [Pseudomonadota bacterium]
MWLLYQFPLCPFSRKIRLLLGEKNIPYELMREDPWAASDQFYNLNPAGCTPVLVDEARGLAIPDSRAIGEYLEETVERSPMLNGNASARAEIRRLTALFDENFYTDVTAPLLSERMKKRIILRQPPDSKALRAAMRLAHQHLDYIDWLIDNRPWLAGSTMSLADLAAAAQISVADYLGGIDWEGHEQTRGWYAVFKS